VDYPHRDIRFTTTEDAVSIAYWEIGEGKPVVILNNWSISHAEMEWSVPSMASFYMDMAEKYRVIRFDPRGVGLSGEPPGGWGAVSESGVHQAMSSREMGFDISAMVTALGLDTFALLAMTVYGPVAIEYAATHPEVSEVILCDSFAAVASSWVVSRLDAQIAVTQIEADTGQILSVWQEIVPPDEYEYMLKLERHNRAQGAGPAQRSGREWDAESFLDRISVPTLILNCRKFVDDPTDAKGSMGDARHLAAAITDSQLRVVEGSLCPYWSDRTATLEAIDALLKPETSTAEPIANGFQTVVFTDIVESTEYVRRVGDEAGRTAIRELETQIASLATDHGGRVVKNLGDGSLVSFGSNSSAISFAVQVQDKCSDGPLQLRIGMAAGEPIQEDGDIHGTVVAQASRIGDLGDAGEVIVSDSVRQLAAGKGFTFEPKGEVSLKGFDEPERVWKVTQTTRT
jgi:class 3 adenylate cyclase